MKTPTLPAYVTPAYLAALVLVEGGGSGAPGDRCGGQELRAWLGLNPRTISYADGVCPILWGLLIRCNDCSTAARAALVHLLPRLVGSRGSAALTRRRQLAAADTVIRVSVPSLLAAIAARPGLSEAQREQILGWRRRLAAIPAVVDDATRHAARGVTMAIRAASAAYAAFDASASDSCAAYDASCAAYDAYAAFDAVVAVDVDVDVADADAYAACDTHAVDPVDPADAVGVYADAFGVYGAAYAVAVDVADAYDAFGVYAYDPGDAGAAGIALLCRLLDMTEESAR